ncbi:MAG: S41 family peptidase [Patescibacteria group bacterium]
MFRREKYTGIVIGALLLVGTFASGVYIGQAQVSPEDQVAGVIGKNEGKPDEVDFAQFWEAWRILDDRYVTKNGNSSTTKAVTANDRVYGAISGLAKSLGDPYTTFFPPEDLKLFESSIRGDFEGVGMEISKKDEILTVVAPLKDSPAEKAGIKSGDKILKINDEVATDLSVEAAVQKIRGQKGTAVKLSIYREGASEPIEVSITRAVIVIPTIAIEQKASKVSAGGKVEDSKGTDLRDGVFVVKLYSFGAQSSNQFAEAINRLSKSDAQKMVIDLRGNPGGYLDAAVDMASWFIPKGKPVVIERGGRSDQDVIYESKGYELPENVKNVKVAILVDRGSASASEILAGALEEYGRAVLVGEKTFGKGSVQELVNLRDGGALKITIARWYTPKGKSISLSGLEPNVKVEVKPDMVKEGVDPVLAKAIEVLNK